MGSCPYNAFQSDEFELMRRITSCVNHLPSAGTQLRIRFALRASARGAAVSHWGSSFCVVLLTSVCFVRAHAALFPFSHARRHGSRR